ncbi:hypothetical protein [Hyunsoonleella rubra]|uniref:Right handed beta helix domain-containing protein n=1 Tax=Hyunsoonleella rubra TaxID=1737062 RepID=A0ABW5TBR9_9FLAO
MKTALLSLKAFIICFIFSTCYLGVAQTTYTVNNTPGTTADYSNLQDAINAASATGGDIIYVQQSPTSYGNITIDRGITLVGRSHSEPNSNYRTTLGNITIAAGASDTTINGIIFSTLTTSASSSTINNLILKENIFNDYVIGNNSLNFNNVVFQGNVISNGLNKRIGSNVSNMIIANNIFLNTTDYQGSDLVFDKAATIVVDKNIFRSYFTNNSADITITNNSSSTLTISNSMFIGTASGHNIVELNNGSFEINNCLTYNPLNATMSFAGTGTSFVNNAVSGNPNFTNDGGIYNNSSGFDRSIADFTLLPGSPAIGAASDGGDIGILNGYNFSMLGQPVNTPYLQIESFSSTVDKNQPLTVTIKANAN